MKRLQRIGRAIRAGFDEAHEQAAIGFTVIALGLEIFTEFDDFATVGILFLAGVTLLGSKRYKGVNIGSAAEVLRDVAGEVGNDATE